MVAHHKKKEARYAAQRAFGNPTLIREQTHATWSWSWLESLARDLRYGFRGMRRNAGSTIFAILIVGLGIGGANPSSHADSLAPEVRFSVIGRQGTYRFTALLKPCPRRGRDANYSAPPAQIRT
jgi:hypothetical protein